MQSYWSRGARKHLLHRHAWPFFILSLGRPPWVREWTLDKITWVSRRTLFLFPFAKLRGRRAITALLTAALVWPMQCDATADERVTTIVLEAPQEVRGLLVGELEVLKLSKNLLDEGERLGVVRRGRSQIAELLATEGYFKPAIEARSDASSISFKVEPGTRARIGQVSVDFKGDIAQPGEKRTTRVANLRAAWILNEGESFRQALWSQAKQTLLQQLQAEDYPAAFIAESLAEVDPDRASVKLRIVYDSGPAFTIGPLQVSGLHNYGRELIDRYNDLKPGERYNQDRLFALQSALQNTPYFSSVLVDIDSDTSNPSNVPVRVQVRESRPKRLGFGVGYTSNTGARAEVNFRHADFLNRAWSLASGVRLEQLRQIAFADVFLPPTSMDYRDSFGVLAEKTDIQGLVTRRAAAGAVRTRVKGSIETRWSLNMQGEERTIGEQAPTTRKALTLGWSWTRRDVDNVLDPRRGNVLNMQFGGATKLLVSDQNFFRSYARYQHYFPVGERDVFTVRGEVGLTAAPSRDGIPQEFLFRAGGAQSVRGYAYQSLGVREAGAVVGGRFIAVGSAEYVHWLDAKWGGAIFYDFGNAVDDRKDYRTFSGVGAGVRWRSPAGPLAFDVGYGVHERRVRPHFSLAIAF